MGKANELTQGVGVEQIIPGENITVSPSNGKGRVTVTSSTGSVSGLEAQIEALSSSTHTLLMGAATSYAPALATAQSTAAAHLAISTTGARVEAGFSVVATSTGLFSTAIGTTGARVEQVFTSLESTYTALSNAISTTGARVEVVWTAVSTTGVVVENLVASTGPLATAISTTGVRVEAVFVSLNATYTYLNTAISTTGTAAQSRLDSLDISTASTLTIIKDTASLTSNLFASAFSSITTLQIATGTLAAQTTALTLHPGNTNYVTVLGSTQTKTGGFNVSGNVGIGTTSPGKKLDILDGKSRIDQTLGTSDYLNSGQTNMQFRVQSSVNANKPGIDIGVLDDKTGIIAVTETNVGAANLQINPLGGNVEIGGTQYAASTTTINGSKFLVASGNVGIGTANPGAKFVVGSIGGTLPTNTSIAMGSVGGGASASVLNTRLTMPIANDSNFGAYIGSYWTDAGSGRNATVIGSRKSSIDYDELALVAGNVGVGNLFPVQKLHMSSGTLFIDGNTANSILAVGNVGIGTTNPADLLTVQGGNMRLRTTSFGTSGNGGIRFTDTSGNPTTLIYPDTNNTFNIQTTGASPAFTIKSDGNVGVGTTAPAKKLQVYGGDVLVWDVAGTGGTIGGYDDHHSIYFREGGGNLTNYYEYGGTLAGGTGHKFYTGGLKGSQTLRLQIADNGIYASENVGIGTTNPGQKLQVAGSVYSTSGGYIFPDGSTQTTAATNFASLTATQTWSGINTFSNRTGIGVTTPIFKLDVMDDFYTAQSTGAAKILGGMTIATYSSSQAAVNSFVPGSYRGDPASNWSVGYNFLVKSTAPIYVTNFGCFTNAGVSVFTSGTRQVGLFDINGVLIASTSVSSAEPAEGDYRYTALSTSIRLEPGATYQAMVYIPETVLFAENASGTPVSLNPDISTVATRSNAANQFSFGTSNPQGGSGLYNPNFKFSKSSDTFKVSSGVVNVNGTITIYNNPLFGVVGSASNYSVLRSTIGAIAANTTNTITNTQLGLSTIGGAVCSGVKVAAVAVATVELASDPTSSQIQVFNSDAINAQRFSCIVFGNP